MPHVGPVQRIALPLLSKRTLLGASLLAMLCAALPQQQAHAQGPRNFATLAMVAEPQTLDPMASTADLVGTIMQHVYETLYTFDAKWNVVPMLAEGMPKISADGKTYAITLAQGRDAAQRPRAHGRRRGRQPAALDGTVAARQGRGQGNRQPQGQGPAGHRHRAEGALRAAAVAARAAQRHGRHHGQGLHRLAAEGLRRHRPLQVQGAPPRPVRAAHALRQVRRAQGARERLRRQARGGHRRAALRARAQRQHARRRCAGRPVRLCRPAAGGSAAAAGEVGRQDRADHDALVRLPVPRAQHQGRRGRQPAGAPGDPGRAGRGRDARGRLRRHALLRGRGQPLSQGLAVLLDRRRRPVQPAQRRQGQGPRPRPATRASPCAC
jgi:hypothetical protein